MRHMIRHLPKGQWTPPGDDQITLDYEGRFLRRRVIETETGQRVLVDLSETTSLNTGDALEAEDGTRIAIAAAEEPLLHVTGDLVRLAWHIGNRHTPCQIAADHLLIREDHVLAAMLQQLGATVTPVTAPFTPEGGAYGHGRTHGHSHGPSKGHSHSHSHSHDHGHTHSHAHSHTHEPGS